MSVAPSGQDTAAVYTSQSLVQRYLPTGAIAEPEDTLASSGKVIVSDLTDLIRKWSRKVDGSLRSKGFEVPFPTITATNPRPPDPVVDIVTYYVVGEVRSILKFGNRSASSVKYYLERADEMLDDLLENPRTIGYGRVTTTEILTKSITADQYGKMTATYYRLSNRNVIEDTLRFVNSAGKEVFRSDGLPFNLRRDYDFVSQAEGTIILFNEPEILSQTGSGGGVVYEFSWRKLDWGQAHPPSLTGVSRL
jgi:hypothetical protein